MRTFFAAIIVLLALAPEAEAGATLSVTITAHADPFCKITAPGSGIDLINGDADIGLVHEICNTPGYKVTTRFSNLNGGQLNVSGRNYFIDETGVSTRVEGEAHARTLDWRLDGARIVEQGAPVVMQVTISPI